MRAIASLAAARAVAPVGEYVATPARAPHAGGIGGIGCSEAAITVLHALISRSDAAPEPATQDIVARARARLKGKS